MKELTIEQARKVLDAREAREKQEEQAAALVRQHEAIEREAKIAEEQTRRDAERITEAEKVIAILTDVSERLGKVSRESIARACGTENTDLIERIGPAIASARRRLAYLKGEPAPVRTPEEQQTASDRAQIVTGERQI